MGARLFVIGENPARPDKQGSFLHLDAAASWDARLGTSQTVSSPQLAQLAQDVAGRVTSARHGQVRQLQEAPLPGPASPYQPVSARYTRNSSNTQTPEPKCGPPSPIPHPPPPNPIALPAPKRRCTEIQDRGHASLEVRPSWGGPPSMVDGWTTSTLNRHDGVKRCKAHTKRTRTRPA